MLRDTQIKRFAVNFCVVIPLGFFNAWADN
jgi:hypothetical protein